MRFLGWGLAAFGVLCWNMVSVVADGGNIISNVQAVQAGLTVHWYTQLQLGREQRLVAAELIVDEDDSTTFFEITGGGRREVISDKDLDAFGKVLGAAGAEQRAKDRAEVIQAELKFHNSQETVAINQYTVPRATVFALGDGGMVHAIDAETGVQLWTTQVGNRRHPTIGLGASKNHVAVVKGSRVYCLEARTGKLLFEHQCNHSVTNSPAVSDDTIFVPQIDGSLMALPIATNGAGTLPLNAVGAALAAPKVAGNLVAWTTEAGYIMVAPKSDINSLRYRVKAVGPFEAAPSANNGRLFAVTYSGFVYAIDDMKGNVLWNFSIGENVAHPPVALGDSVFIFTEEKRLYQFNAATGEPSAGWEKPIQNLSAFAGASANRLYARDPVGNIQVLDIATGQPLGRVNSRTPFTSIENVQSDRLYVCTKTGLLECLREIGQNRPHFHGQTETAGAKKSEGDATDPFGKKSDGKPEVNPFGNDANPFGSQPDSNDKKEGGDSNPFGGGGN